MTASDYEKAKQEHAELTERIKKIDTLKSKIAANLQRAEQRLAALVQQYPAVLAGVYLGGDVDLEAHRAKIADVRQFIEEAPLTLKGLEPHFVRAVNERDRLTNYVIRPWESVGVLKAKFATAGTDVKYRDMLTRDLRAAAAQVGQVADAEQFLASLKQ